MAVNMNHAITIGDIFWPVLVIGGLGLVGALFIFLVALFNPFGSGH